MLTASLHERACKGCGKTFMQLRPLQYVCGPVCAGKVVRSDKKAKKQAERKADRAKRQQMKSIAKLHSEARLAFNKWVRERDAKLPCISCGAPPPDLSALHAGRDAGHYRSVGTAPHLRYDEANVHAQCVHCNQFLAGNQIAYRVGLVAKVGLGEVERLEADNTVRKWKRGELEQIKFAYRKKLRDLKA